MQINSTLRIMATTTKETRIMALIICVVCCFIGRMTMVFADQGNHSLQVKSATWCIAKPSTPAAQLDSIINFCCTNGGVDCSLIQPGGSCYLPYNKVSDASVVMNIYYTAHGKTTISCYFAGNGLTVTVDPSVDTCIYQASL